jgi:hypothetical protein
MTIAHIRRVGIVAVASSILVGSMLASAQRAPVDVSGTWSVTGSSPTGPVESTVILKQEGDSLSGSIEIVRVGWSKLTGSVRGDTVRYVFPLNMQGTPIEVRVTGVLKDKDSMAGTVDLPSDMGSYPFTAQRKPTE